MMNYSGQNRGFAYVQFFDDECTQKALLYLNHFKISDQKFRLLACISDNNCMLVLGKIQCMLLDTHIIEIIRSSTKLTIKNVMLFLIFSHTKYLYLQ